MSDLNVPSDGSISDNFATIPDVSIDAIASRIAPNQVASGVTRGIQQLGSDKVYSDGGNNQIIVKDTVPRVLMGNQATFGEGFYVSKTGIDATKNTDASQFIFNSNQNVFKIVKTDTVTQVIPNPLTAGTTNTLTVAHGLSYIPILQAFLVSSDSLVVPQGNYVALPYSLAIKIAGTWYPGLYISARTDTTNIYFDVTVWTNSNIADLGTFRYRYYLTQESAN